MTDPRARVVTDSDDDDDDAWYEELTNMRIASIAAHSGGMPSGESASNNSHDDGSSWRLRRAA